MSTSDDIEAIEKRAYGRGYAAGRKRLKLDRSAEHIQRERQAFLDKAFLAALPSCIDANGWVSDGKPITNIEQRTSLAWDFAVRALRQRRTA